MRSRLNLAVAVAVAVVAAVGVLCPATASAHAQLTGTEPGRGAVLAHAPAQVVFRFGEPIEATFGAVRVLDARGARVDTGPLLHPGGHGDRVGVALRTHLPAGSYTAAYRVISADGHPVSGGFIFSVGSAGAGRARAVADVLGPSGGGPVTAVAAGAARGATYLATALTLGVLIFLLAVWGPALAASAGAGAGWQAAAQALAVRARRLVLAGATVGVVAGLAGLVAQGATAEGVSFWSAADPTTVGDVLATRFGRVWGLRILDFAAVAVAVGVLLGGRRWPVLRPAALGADGLAPAPAPAAARAGLLVPALLLALGPALAGHAATEHSVALLAPLDVLHVLAMSAWLGGLVALLVLVPAATRRLAGPERSAALAGVLVRFSPLALGCVVVLAATGPAQAYLEIRHLDALTATAFGRAVLVKVALLLAVVALGAVNRRRIVPRLRAIAARADTPGTTGVLLRRTLRAEVALLVVVLGVTSALVSYAPPVSAVRGPFSATTRMGPIEAEVTVDPATAGANALHLYLFDAGSGAQFTHTKALNVRASLPGRSVGPIEVDLRRVGPGHYVSQGLALVPAGTWTLELTDRVSEFDEYIARLRLPVR